MKLTCHEHITPSDAAHEVSKKTIALFNFLMAAKQKLQNKLLNIQWEEVIISNAPVTTLHDRFTAALLTAAKNANVPQYKQYR